ncbi:TetR/AcrR family transcriptional regulator [Mycobacterium shimoidei]|uniref:TetR/AcrR family transcriptional regulator n=1 Tax=Mycobacterium shimoidei TaxID=29313 RepID=UPI000DE901CF|nr:TetR family transcriptional regulator [Mycobacterium shimoidei]
MPTSQRVRPARRRPPSESRQTQRLKTRARLFDAALNEIAQHGLATADVTAIATAAGVVRGTFYFHFPTKEHVLVELERTEETRIVADLEQRDEDLTKTLTRLVEHALEAERRLGAVVFRDMLGLHFMSSRPVDDELAEHPLAGFLMRLIADAQRRGHVQPDADPAELATFFLTGFFALLATGANDPRLLKHYVITIVKGMEKR